MKGFFRRLFHIYSGEEKNAFLFACLGFLWALGITSGLKFADALFLLHVGADSLTIAYTLTACVMMVLATFLLKAFHSTSPKRIYIALLLAGVCFYSFIYLCLALGVGAGSQWLWFALRICGSLFFSIGITCYWTFVDQYYHLQDAKRLFCLFSSAIFLGVATTGAIMRSGMFDFQTVTLMIVALLLASIYWIRKISSEVPPIYDEDTIETTGDHENISFRSLVRSILESKFTLLLMTSNFLILVLQVTTEYSYLSAFDAHFDNGTHLLAGGEEKASLTLFLGQCIAGVSILNLIFGLFVYSRLVRRFGVSNLLLLTPLVLVFNFTGWSLDPILVFPVIGFFVVEGMLYMIDDNNFTLLLNAVPPKMKHKIRLLIESFFEPVGMLTSSLLITLAPFDSKTLGLIIAACALVVGLILRKRYVKAIYLNLAENAIHFQRSVKDWFLGMSAKKQKAAERRLLAIMLRGDEKAHLFAAEGLLGFGDRTILQKLLQLSDHLEDTGKIALLTILGSSEFAQDPHVLMKMQEWQQRTKEQSLVQAIHLYFAKLGLVPPEEVVYDLESSNLVLRGAAIMSFKRPWPHLAPAIVMHHQAIAAQQIQHLLETGDEDKICLALTVLGLEPNPQNVDILLPFLTHSSIKIVRHAASAIARVAGESNVNAAPALIAQLKATSDTDVRQSCLRALGNIASTQDIKPIIKSSLHFRPNERRLTESVIFQMGAEAVPVLLKLAKDTAMHDRCRVLAGRILGRLALPILRHHLYDIIQLEIERAYFYFYHYHAIHIEYPEIDLTLLRDALLSSFQSVLDFIIQLLGVAGEVEDCELLSRSLRSINPKIRSQVLETLERTCEPRIFRELYPLIADLPQEEKMHAYLHGGRKSLTLEELLDQLARSSIQADQIVAMALRYRLNSPNWREMLQRQLNEHDIPSQPFVRELLET